MLETHKNIESIAAEAADGVAATSAARWERATRELLRLTRQRDELRSFRGTCVLSVRSARLRSSDWCTLQGVQGLSLIHI